MTPRTAKTRMLVALVPLSLCVLPALAQAQAAAPAKPATAEPPAAQDTVPVVKKFGEIGGWTIYAASVDGQHMACSAGPRGEPGMKAVFEQSSEGMTVLVATVTKGAEGDEVKGSYDIDGKATRIPFYRRENNRNMGFLKEAHAKQLAAGKGKVMTVTIGSEKTVLPLDGVAAAIKQVALCNEKEGK